MQNPSKYHIRLIQQEDQNAAHSLQNEFIEEFFPEFIGDSRLNEWNKDMNDLYSTYSGKAGIFWVVENDSEVIGMGGIKISDEGPVISRVRIREGERRKGIGTLLLKHMEDYCLSKGYPKVFVDTENHMISAVRFDHDLIRRQLSHGCIEADGMRCLNITSKMLAPEYQAAIPCT